MLVLPSSFFYLFFFFFVSRTKPLSKTVTSSFENFLSKTQKERAERKKLRDTTQRERERERERERIIELPQRERQKSRQKSVLLLLPTK